MSEYIEKANSDFGGLPVCPYARKAAINQKKKFGILVGGIMQFLIKRHSQRITQLTEREKVK